MALNKVKQGSNMYQFCNATWNAVKGVCEHGCQYCYMKSIWRKCHNPKVYLDEKEFKVCLGKGQTIFVGSSTDMFAENIPAEWIDKTILHCKMFHLNTYIFQSKNPLRFKRHQFPHQTIYATTIETNRQDLIDKFSKAPSVIERVDAMKKILDRKMITIEPIMDFDLEPLVDLCRKINPEFINVGSNSKNGNWEDGVCLPEPSQEKVSALIEKLSEFTKVNKKTNLCRIIK